MSNSIRLTVGQALVRFVAKQYVERDGHETALLKEFGVSLVTAMYQGWGKELWNMPKRKGCDFTGHSMSKEWCHIAAAFAKHRNRLSTFACTTSIGPGALNMVTGAGLRPLTVAGVASAERLFCQPHTRPRVATDRASKREGCQRNDAFRPVSRFFDRISRPEQLLASLPEAFRTLTDPAETGAATVSLPEDVQAEALDWPVEFFEKRVWHVRRPLPEPELIKEVVSRLQRAKCPIIISGGGTIYSEAWPELKAFAEEFGIAVTETRQAKVR